MGSSHVVAAIGSLIGSDAAAAQDVFIYSVKGVALALFGACTRSEVGAGTSAVPPAGRK